MRRCVCCCFRGHTSGLACHPSGHRFCRCFGTYVADRATLELGMYLFRNGAVAVASLVKTSEGHPRDLTSHYSSKGLSGQLSAAEAVLSARCHPEPLGGCIRRRTPGSYTPDTDVLRAPGANSPTDGSTCIGLPAAEMTVHGVLQSLAGVVGHGINNTPGGGRGQSLVINLGVMDTTRSSTSFTSSLGMHQQSGARGDGAIKALSIEPRWIDCAGARQLDYREYGGIRLTSNRRISAVRFLLEEK